VLVALQLAEKLLDFVAGIAYAMMLILLAAWLSKWRQT